MVHPHRAAPELRRWRGAAEQDPGPGGKAGAGESGCGHDSKRAGDALDGQEPCFAAQLDAGGRGSGFPGAGAAQPPHPAGRAAADGGRCGSQHGLDAVRRSMHRGAGLRSRAAEPAEGRGTGQLPAGERRRTHGRAGCGDGASAPVCAGCAEGRHHGGESAGRRPGPTERTGLRGAETGLFEAGRDAGAGRYSRSCGRGWASPPRRTEPRAKRTRPGGRSSSTL